MISACLNRLLPRWLACVFLAGFFGMILFLPFLTWMLVFKAWNWWASSAGWHVIIPVNWKTVVSAVVICWFIRWVICRKAS